MFKTTPPAQPQRPAAPPRPTSEANPRDLHGHGSRSAPAAGTAGGRHTDQRAHQREQRSRLCCRLRGGLRQLRRPLPRSKATPPTLDNDGNALVPVRSTTTPCSMSCGATTARSGRPSLGLSQPDGDLRYIKQAGSIAAASDIWDRRHQANLPDHREARLVVPERQRRSAARPRGASPVRTSTVRTSSCSWTTFSDGIAPVVTGRSASAAATGQPTRRSPA